MPDFEVMAKELDEARAQFKETSERTIKGAIRQFMDAHSEVGLLEWEAYVPGFNDGDPCTFTVSGPRIVLADKAPLLMTEDYSNGGDDAEFFEEHGLEDYQIEYRKELNLPDALKQDFKGLCKLFSSCEDGLEKAFGSNVRVVVGRDGEAKVTDYDCGH